MPSSPNAREAPSDLDRPGMPTRADALDSRQRILSAAAQLQGDRRTSMAEIAAAAGVGRSTLYRHFPTRASLTTAVAQTDGPDPVRAPSLPDPSRRISLLPYRAPGALGTTRPLALDVTHVLDEVPPHLIAEQLVAEARRAAGVAIALYV